MPSGPAHFVNPLSATSVVIDGRTLYIVLGEGGHMAGEPPNYGVNANGPSSPIFSSVLRADLSGRGCHSRAVSYHDGPPVAANGHDVELPNAAGDRAMLQVVTMFRQLVKTDANTATPGANPTRMLRCSIKRRAFCVRPRRAAATRSIA